jgi:hypothetical protein
MIREQPQDDLVPIVIRIPSNLYMFPITDVFSNPKSPAWESVVVVPKPVTEMYKRFSLPELVVTGCVLFEHIRSGPTPET